MDNLFVSASFGRGFVTIQCTFKMLKSMFFCFLLAVVMGTENYELYKNTATKLHQKLNSDYNPQYISNVVAHRGGRVVVRVNVSITNFEVDDVNMEYFAEVTLQQTWSDRRLRSNTTQTKIPYIKLNSVNKIWKPDTFFANEKKGYVRNTITPYLKIFSDGTITYITTLRLKLTCPMNFKLFPMDQHICYMRIASYAYTTDDLLYFWDSNDATQMVQQGLLQPTTFELKAVAVDYCNAKTNTGEFSCLMVKFWLKRIFWPYFMQVYTPCCFLIFISWLPFWLKKDAVLERIFIDTILLLFMLCFIQNTYTFFPASSYLKAVDIWMYGSLAFILTSFIVVVLTSKSSNKSEMACDDMLVHLDNEIENEEHNIKPKALNRIFSNADFIFRILFPVAFVLFIYIYYCYVSKVDDE